MAYPSVYPTETTIYDPQKCWNGYTIFQAKEVGATLHVGLLALHH